MHAPAWAARKQPKMREAAALLAKIARAVHYVHQHGVIHRDIKPANLMIDAESGEPMLMDFGLAKDLGEAQMTHTGDVMGTRPTWPRSRRPAESSRSGRFPTSTRWAPCSTNWSPTGRPSRVGPGKSCSACKRRTRCRCQGGAARAHRDLETICLKAMSKEAKGRYATAAELADNLERFAAGEPILARRRSGLVRCWSIVRRRPLIAALVTIAVLLAVAGGLLAMHGRQQQHAAQLVGLLATELEAEDWSAGHLEHLDAIIAEIGGYSAAQGMSSRERLIQRWATSLESQLSLPSLSPETVANMERD